MDVHLTADNIVVIAHDYDLSRTCDLKPDDNRKYIGDFYFDELPPLRNNFITGVFNETFYENTHNKDFKICKLEELFIMLNKEENKDVIVNIDLKKGPVVEDYKIKLDLPKPGEV